MLLMPASDRYIGASTCISFKFKSLCFARLKICDNTSITCMGRHGIKLKSESLFNISFEKELFLVAWTKSIILDLFYCLNIFLSLTVEINLHIKRSHNTWSGTNAGSWSTSNKNNLYQ